MRVPDIWRGESRLLPSRWDDFNRLVDEFFGGFARQLGRGMERQVAFVPDVDLIERADRFVLRAELPGVDAKDLSINLLGNALEIRGQKSEEFEEKDENYRFCERSYGAFARTVNLPSAVDESKIEAALKDGVLEVTCPKLESAKARTIEVRSGAPGEVAPKKIEEVAARGPSAAKPHAREERERKQT